MGLTSSWKGIFGGPGNWGKRLIWERDVKVDYDRNQTRVCVGFVRVKKPGVVYGGGYLYHSGRNDGEYESWENTCVSLNYGTRDMRFRKK